MSGRRAARAAAIDTGQAGGQETYRLVDRADEPADYSGWAKRWTWPGLVAVATAFGMVAGGVDWWRSVLVAVGVGVALWSLIAGSASGTVRWHDDVPGRVYRLPSTWEVPGLAAARESDAAFADYLRPRLWDLAQQLLARRGIDPASDRARAVIGQRNYRVLVGEDTDPRHTSSSVSALCQTIAALAVDPSIGGTIPSPSPALTGLAGHPAPRSRTHLGRAAGSGARQPERN